MSSAIWHSSLPTSLLWRCGQFAPLHHPDGGTQFTSEQLTRTRRSFFFPCKPFQTGLKLTIQRFSFPEIIMWYIYIRARLCVVPGDNVTDQIKIKQRITLRQLTLELQRLEASKTERLETEPPTRFDGRVDNAIASRVAFGLAKYRIGG